MPGQDGRAAFFAFVERWELVIWDTSNTAHSLGQNLTWAAQDYERSEYAVMLRMLQALPVDEERCR